MRLYTTIRAPSAESAVSLGFESDDAANSITASPKPSANTLLVIGGGPAGLLAAQRLAEAGCRVAALRGAGYRRAQVSGGRPRRLQPHQCRGARRLRGPLCRPATRFSGATWLTSPPPTCAPGLPIWASAPSWAPAAGCFPRSSTSRPTCCGPGWRGCATLGVGVSFAPPLAGLRGRNRPAPAQRGHRRGTSPSAPTPRCWPWAGPAGQKTGSDGRGCPQLQAIGVPVRAVCAGQLRGGGGVVGVFPGEGGPHTRSRTLPCAAAATWNGAK